MKLIHGLLVISLLMPLVAKAADWTQYRGPNSDGTTDEAIGITNWGTRLKEVWRTDANLGFSSFTVADARNTGARISSGRTPLHL